MHAVKLLQAAKSLVSASVGVLYSQAYEFTRVCHMYSHCDTTPAVGLLYPGMLLTPPLFLDFNYVACQSTPQLKHHG